MKYTAAVITMSDKGSQGLRKDTSGPAVQEILKENVHQHFNLSRVFYVSVLS